MNFIEFREALNIFPAFSTADIIKLDPRFDRRRLVEWQQKNYIQKIRNGYYCFSMKERGEGSLFYLSNMIYKPSYISLETALSYYNLIPEGVYLYTGVSTRKTIMFETPFGNYKYHKIKKELFFGYKLEQIGEYNVKLAEVEKTILDLFYFRRIYDKKAIDGLRLNREIAREIINQERLLNYLSEYKSSVMERRINLLIEYIYA